MTNGWDFPLNTGHGQSEGLNIHGIDFFRAKFFEHLAREIIQNSLDAKNKNVQGPVLVKFNHFILDSNDLPGKDQLEKVFQICSEEDISTKDKKFFDKGRNILTQNKIDVLKVSDYNTTGLRGVKENKEEWQRLITKGGDSKKSSGSGGSYGIGKNAPFACSLLHTVYYSTFNINNEKGFQGVSKLASHHTDKGETRGTGYYRNKETFAPIMDLTQLNELFHRNEYGTDVFVVGLKNPKEWKERVIKAVLDNFFVAIHEGKLEVEVESLRICKESLSELIVEYIEEDRKLITNEFYQALLQEPVSIDFEGGKLELYLKEDPNYNRRVAMVRDLGMKIYHLDRFPTGLYFSGVMIARGNDLNEFLRQTEPPTHDDWKPDLHEDEKMAEKKLKSLRSTIRDQVKKLIKIDESENVELEGLNDLLPDLTNEGNPFDDTDKSDNISDRPKKVEIKLGKKRKISIGDINQPKKRRKKRKDLDNGKRRERSGKNGKNNSNLVKINRIRSRETQEEGTYKVSIYSDNNGSGYVQVKIVGEDARSYFEPLQKVIELDTNKSLLIREDGKIGPLNFEKENPKHLLISLQEDIRSSLEVSVHED